jgi:hypothetical protein
MKIIFMENIVKGFIPIILPFPFGPAKIVQNGYRESANFCRAFKAWFKQSPTAYRRNPLS